MYTTKLSYPHFVAATLIGGVALCAWAFFSGIPAYSASATREGGSFVLRLFNFAGTDNYGSMRFNTKTGETWYTAEELRWQKAGEAEPIPDGEYDISVVPAIKGFAASRIDRIKGTTWTLRNRAWVQVQEP
jgi:hypothetical protein